MAVSVCGGTVSLAVEIAFASGSGFGVWDESVWDSATWGPDVTWTDVSAYLLHENGINVDRAFSRDLQGWNPGTCSFVLNNTDGRFSPTNLSGPYVTAGVTEVRPWRPVRIRATHVSSGVTYDVFRGYILSWGEVWERGANLAQTTVSCVDELASLGRFDGFEQAAVGSGDTFGARMHRILNNAGHVGDRNIDVGSHTFQSTTLAGNAVTELKLTADSEGGTLWIDADGTVVGEGQESVLSDSRSNTVQWVLSDSPGAGEYPYRDVDLAYDGDLVENVVSLARSGGTEQSASDLDSRALYGDKRYSRSDLVCSNDTQVAALATLRLLRHVDPELRMTAVHVKAPRSDTDLFPLILGAKPLDRLRVERTPPGGDAINQQVFVSGIHHRIDTVSWATKFDTSSTTGYPADSEMGIWGVATYADLTGASGCYISTPDSTAFNVGDIDIRVRVSATDWTSGSTQMFAGKDDSGTQRTFNLYVNGTGSLAFVSWNQAGTLLANATSSVVPAFTDGTAYWVRVTNDIDNGAAGNDTIFYSAPDSDEMPSSWTQIGSTRTRAVTGTSLFDGTAPCFLGTERAGSSARLTGRIYRAQIRNGIGGTVVADFYPDLDAEGGDTTVVSSATGETWTLNGAATLVAAGSKWDSTFWGPS